MSVRGKSKRKFEEIPKQSSRPREDLEFKLIKKIGTRIKSDLVNQEWSVDKLAIESETSRGSVRRIIEGKSNTSIMTLDRIARALGYEGVIEFFKKI